MSQFSNLSSHILQASAQMVGVCMVIISIVRLLHLGNTASHIVDRILGIDNIVFLLSAILSYASMRYTRLTDILEGLADTLFMMGLIFMTLASVLLSFEIL
ncbi:hypothetical protein [Sulfuriferula sp.]|uniref:hypothetical protein n=1 Tax=Sulfuriferula sp. TaxID=2025307 RepID=UPI002730C15A|nr:hypothetical protein [Sulfuriferula sp.]MDP2024624.1 hypothetical protein [Sulfuriferula sp.]